MITFANITNNDQSAVKFKLFLCLTCWGQVKSVKSENDQEAQEEYKGFNKTNTLHQRAIYGLYPVYS